MGLCLLLFFRRGQSLFFFFMMAFCRSFSLIEIQIPCFPFFVSTPWRGGVFPLFFLKPQTVRNESSFLLLPGMRRCVVPSPCRVSSCFFESRPLPSFRFSVDPPELHALFFSLRWASFTMPPPPPPPCDA